MAIRSGDRDEKVKAIQHWLREMRLLSGPVDGIFGPQTEKSVIRFQEEAGLYADGIVGPVTFEALEKAIAVRSLEMTSPGLAAVDGHPLRMQFVRCPADAHADGYDFTWLRQDAAEAYNKVYEHVSKLGGKLTSSGGRRSLYADVNPNRSAMSFHYSGLALDLCIWSGMKDTATDPYVIRRTSPDDRRFEVFVRCTADTVAEKEIENVWTYENYKNGEPKPIKGKFINLTEVFQNHGFQPIRGRRAFFEKGVKLAAEWWHFQYEKALCSEVSTFGGELLKIYSEKELKDTPPWRFRDKIFKIDWF